MKSDVYQPSGANVTFSAAYRRRTLAILLAIYVFNFIDRQILIILAQPIQADLGLSDTQLGLLTGIAFAACYTLCGIPIARWAERSHRPRIIAVAGAVWSTCTIASAFAMNFFQMLLARFGVAIGEAGLVPPAHSLITEFTPPEKRATAMAIFSLGGPLGMLFGLGIGGLLAGIIGWRATFFVAGVPGLILALIGLKLFIEPRALQGFKPAATGQADAPQSMIAALRVLARNRTFCRLSAATTVLAIGTYGLSAFSGVFFMRNHAEGIAATAKAFGMDPLGLLGITLGVAFGLAGAAGSLIGGHLADRLRANGREGYVLVPTLSTLCSVPAYIAFLILPDFWPSIFALMIASVLTGTWYGPGYATMQSIVRPDMRATVSAVALTFITLFGLGLGPTLVGMISDLARSISSMDEASGLRAAMLSLTIFPLLSGLFFWSSGRSLTDDLAAVSTGEAAQ